MKCIVGLGNPGKQYETTRHNVGFMLIDELSKQANIQLNQSKHQAIYGTGLLNREKVLLIKPLTYMNLSGEAIRPLMDYYKVMIDDLLVVYDDMDIPVGKIRLRTKGSAGGHNGVKSTIQHTGTNEFKRIRIGIGRPPTGMPVSNYVLQSFTKDEMDLVTEGIMKSVNACDTWMKSSFVQVMNQFNT